MSIFTKTRTKHQIIDFRTDTRRHGSRAPGVGVYEGVAPKVDVPMSLDGEPLAFKRIDTAHRIKRALTMAEQLRARKVNVDCFGFIALHQEAIRPDDIASNRERWMTFDTGEVHIEPEQMVDGEAYALGSLYHDFTKPIIRHGVIAAEAEEGMLFFSILGSDGPLAISGLSQVQNVFSAYSVRSLDNIRPL